MKFIIIVFTCIVLFNGVSSLQCYACSSNDRSCQNGQAIPLQTCEPAQLYCVTTEVTAILEDGTEIVNTALSCQNMNLTGCQDQSVTSPIKAATSCFTSCTTDGCNQKKTSATDDGRREVGIPTVAILPETTSTANDAATSSQSPAVSESATSSSQSPGNTKETTGSFRGPESTTSSAKEAPVSVKLIFSLFASTMFALLL